MDYVSIAASAADADATKHSSADGDADTALAHATSPTSFNIEVREMIEALPRMSIRTLPAFHNLHYVDEELPPPPANGLIWSEIAMLATEPQTIPLAPRWFDGLQMNRKSSERLRLYRRTQNIPVRQLSAGELIES